MKTILQTVICILLLCNGLAAQRTCVTAAYQQQQLDADPALASKIQALQHTILAQRSLAAGTSSSIQKIKIPVVVHVLYHDDAQNISAAQVQSQIAALNRDFSLTNTDAEIIPARFASLAADCQIEFVLATSDPKGRATNGIVRKYTPVTEWTMDDRIKFTSQMGDDAWDAAAYLNIWVGNLHKLAGYASIVGGPAEKDGLVINVSAFGTINVAAPFDKGRTVVHEAGHWLGLKHIWGDADCGDDGIADTPPQRSFTTGCPTGIRVTCSSAPDGDMYMNYMDFTNDACLLMFTNGQKEKMRSLLAPGGYRNSLLYSRGLDAPVSTEIPLPEEGPKWMKVKMYPNPVSNELNIDIAFDLRWVGQTLTIVNMVGQVQLQQVITGKTEKINVRKLVPGIYFIKGEKAGDKFTQKFVKL